MADPLDLDALAWLVDESSEMSPAPWSAEPRRGEHDREQRAYDANHEPVADCYGDYDAALIVTMRNAAKSLLAELRELRADSAALTATAARLREALTKIGHMDHDASDTGSGHWTADDLRSIAHAAIAADASATKEDDRG